MGGTSCVEGGGGPNSRKYDLFIQINNTREWWSPNSVKGAWGCSGVKIYVSTHFWWYLMPFLDTWWFYGIV